MDKVIIAVGALLIVYAIWQTIQKFRGKAKSSCCGSAEAVTVKKVEDTDISHYPYRYKLQVEGMTCSHCAANVENALNNMPGVWSIVNLGKNEADVRTKEPVEEKSFAAALEAASYGLGGYALVSGSAQ
jgi:copper chaperone CopZ